MEDRLSPDEVFAFMDEVKIVAHHLLRQWHGASLQTTGLMLTAFRRLGYADQDWSTVTWENRRHFFGAVRRAMKQSLSNHARAERHRLQHEILVDPTTLQFYELKQTLQTDPARVLALEEALAELERQHPDWVEAIEYRFYVGLTLEETARMMDVNERQIRRWWDRAQPWLYERILQMIHEGMREGGAHDSAN
jgi:DNA-directed RNA polymerase specialized sigma24 family protein